jgi:hypothetical protein
MANIESRWMLLGVVLAFIIVGLLMLLLASVEIQRTPMGIEPHSSISTNHGSFVLKIWLY